jgi:hypothetical protein
VSDRARDSRVARWEREALIEWILVRRRLLVVVLVVIALAIPAAIGILYAFGVSHLSKSELRHFAHQQSLMPRGREGPIIEKVPHE